MSNDRKTVSVNILGKDYQVSCDPLDETMLTASARHLDQSMQEIRGTGKVVGSDRIAVMAALNVTNDMLHGKRQSTESSAVAEQEISRLTSKLENALQRIRELPA